jgi:nucleoside-diphosphate-sugar epimerase
MSRVTVTGGAGNLGREVTLLLARRPHRVRIFDLPDVDYAFADDLDAIEVVHGDLRERATVAESCRGAEWVVHLAAVMPPLSEAQPDLAWAINVQGTRTLLEVMPQEAKLVFVSSVATYGLAQTEIVGLEHPQRPIDFYGRTKVQNESDIRASGCAAAILRLAAIAVPALLEIPRPWFFAREQKVEFIHLHDAALAVANCIGDEGALRRAWLVAGGPSWRMKGEEYSSGVCEAFGYAPETATFLDAPNWQAWYDTRESQAKLNYQQHSFADFVGQLSALYREAVG